MGRPLSWEYCFWKAFRLYGHNYSTVITIATTPQPMAKAIVMPLFSEMRMKSSKRESLYGLLGT